MKIEMVSVEKIKPDPNQPRKEFDKEKLAEMAETYKNHGAIVPIEIDEKNMVILGERRLLAAKLAKIKTLPCIRKIGLSEADRLSRQLCEETMKEKISYDEKVKALERLASLEGKDKLTELRSSGNLSSSTLERAELYRTAPEEMKKAVREGKLGGEAIANIRRLKNPGKETELFNKAKKEGWGHARVAKEVEIEKVKELLTTKDGRKTPEDFVQLVSSCLWSVAPFLDRRHFPAAIKIMEKKLRNRLLKDLKDISGLFIEPAIEDLEAVA